MLKVEVGYYDFTFSDDEQEFAIMFARTAREHITRDDKSVQICIKFEDEKEEKS